MEHKSVIYAYLLIEKANQIDDIQSFLNNFCCRYSAMATAQLQISLDGRIWTIKSN